MPSGLSLGLVQLDERTFEHDLAISERYQAFSSELLRLALLGLAGVGFLLVSLDPAKDGQPSVIRGNLSSIAPWLYATLACLGVCCAASLAHRYVSADGLAFHLKYLRLLKSGSSPEDKTVQEEREGRSKRWNAGTILLAVAAGALAGGAASLAAAFAIAVKVLSPAG